MKSSEEVAFQLAPWGARQTDEEQPKDVDLEPWIKRSIIDRREWAPAPTPSILVAFGAFVGVGVWALIIWATWAVIGTPPDAYWPGALAVMGVVAAVGAMGTSLAEDRLAPKHFLRQLGAGTGTLLGVVLISIGLPAVAILVGGSWNEVPHAFGPPTLEITWETLRQAAAGAWRWTEGQDPQRLLGSLLQLVFITTASLLPALFYFQFDRQKLSTLRERFFRSVVIIDPDARTIEHAKSVYGTRADDMLGRPLSEGQSPSQGMTRQGIIVTATILVTLGWIVTLSPMSAHPSGVRPSLLAYFEPEKNVFVFAFLGAYVFGIAMLFRRYVRSDLTPQAYAHFTVRTISALLIAWTVSLMSFPTLGGAEETQTTSVAAARRRRLVADSVLASQGAAGGETIGDDQDESPAQSQAAEAPLDDPGAFKLVFAFLIGFFPQTGMSLLKQAASMRLRAWTALKTPNGLSVDSESSLPLERLDGINVYHQTRLMDEGIENVENLAHADIIELMLATRIPLSTLVDWIDQAILLIHVKEAADMKKVRSYGIRTATDLESACREVKRRGEEGSFLGLLGPEKPAAGPPRLRSILDALADDQWMSYLRRCRSPLVTGQILTNDSRDDWDLGEEAWHGTLWAAIREREEQS